MSTERSDWSGAGINFERHVAMVPIQLGELHLVVELYCSSSSVGMICLVRRTVVFAVVMSTFLQICVESALRVTTKLNIQSVDPSTNLMMCAALSSSRMVSNWDRLAKSIFCCGCTIGSTLSSISSLTCGICDCQRPWTRPCVCRGCVEGLCLMPRWCSCIANQRWLPRVLGQEAFLDMICVEYL